VGVYLRANPDLYEKSLKISWVMNLFVEVASFFKQYAFVAGIGLSLFSIPIHLIYAYFGTMFLLIVCRKICQREWLELWGKNSLVVYALHFVPLLYYSNLL
jgi:fucose 4-O-acetylase-like acetyltransferase